ncbi:uncharacterized protein METZ01_LOCUS110509 [marine metagenome]|uniref:Uncharacterized protein n=1 Tax=marine metagenome TaxID=408172 RepID=A0A381WYS3_9ZZZZ
MISIGVKRVFGIPFQFVLVCLVSTVLTIYLAAAAASSRVEARTSESGSLAGDSYKWEQAAIWACPLH